MAARIREVAAEHRVPIVENPPLARALYFTGDIGTEIQEGLYSAVAAILAHVYRLERGEASDLPDVDVPKDMRFTPEGRPM